MVKIEHQIVNQETKIQLVLSEIERLEGSEFAYSDSKTALKIIEELFKSDLSRLLSLKTSKNSALLNKSFIYTNFHLTNFMDVLGLILRSTNVRNAFEFYNPLRILLTDLIGSEAGLILSSEWDYSPFTYPPVIEELPDFVLLGLPATESSNVLIIPAAGHEFGHSVWVKAVQPIPVPPRVQRRPAAKGRRGPGPDPGTLPHHTGRACVQPGCFHPVTGAKPSQGYSRRAPHILYPYQPRSGVCRAYEPPHGRCWRRRTKCMPGSPPPA